MNTEEELVKMTAQLKIAKDDYEKMQEEAASEEMKELHAKKENLLKDIEKNKEVENCLNFQRHMSICQLERTCESYRVARVTENRKAELSEHIDGALSAFASAPTIMAMIKKRHATGAPSTSRGKERNTSTGRPGEDAS